MMPMPADRYNEAVHDRWGRGAVLLFALGCWTGFLAAPARADEQILVGATPVLDVQLGTGSVTVHTWNRPQVQISGDGVVSVQHLASSAVDPTIPKQIPNASHTVDTVHGPVTLAPEMFVLPRLQGTHHDEVRATGNGNVVITVPATTALVAAHVDRGRVTLDDYHGAFVTQVHDGGIFLNRVSGTGYVESLRGRVVATDSTFERLRVRTATSNVTFNRCTSHQIEATSAYGSIVYNNGSFQPGLARFESEHGNVALGVRGGAQIGAHSDGGHVISSFSNPAAVRGGPNTTQARVQGGGPVVTATSRDGSVYLYNGSIESHPRVRADMRGARLVHAPIFRPARRLVPDRRLYQPRQYAPAPRQFAPPPPRQYAPPPRQYVPPAPPYYAPPRQQTQQPQPQQQNGRAHRRRRGRGQPPA